jgi:thioredoxin 1
MAELPNALVIDVRTPEECKGGMIKKAVNYDFNGANFNTQIAKLDKNEPVFVYCLSGGRSGAAASQMRADGFKEVYELDGGMMKWNAAGLAVTQTSSEIASSGMTMDEYNKLLATDKIVLVDFYAEWCAPCKKMKPYLAEIDKEMNDKVVVIRIDVDKNKDLAAALKIESIPVLAVYKNKTLTWSNIGFIEKEKVVEQLK